MDDSMGNFKSCGNKGFQMTFGNGWTISVQWSALNDCSRSRPDVDDMKTEFVDSETAEIAVWDADRTYLNISGSDTVLAHRSPEEAARWIAAVADFKDMKPARKVKK
jgi:hypothetical protein